MLGAAFTYVSNLSHAVTNPAQGADPGTRAQLPPHQPWYWLISGQDLELMKSMAPRLVARVLSSPTTLVLLGSGAPSALDGAVPTELFTSYSAFERDLARGRIAAATRAVAYDPEFWPGTPAQEQAAPLRQMALFARAARRAGYQAVLMPGRDLLLSQRGQCRKRRGETLNSAFLRCHLANGAHFAQLFEIQSAPVELAAGSLRGFVAASAREAHAANPSAIVVATLSTVSGHRPVGLAQLERAAHEMRPFVEGFQLNITPGTVRVAIALLQKLAAPAR
jgi:hypothetical protein